MYRVGFGDCFLVSMPTPRSMAHILIDCGAHPQGDLGLIPDVVADVASVCDRHLDLVIATNAHRDHISGFAQCEQEFKRFTVGEVWLPWTENEEDAQAARLKQKHTDLAHTLRQHFEAKGMVVDGTPGGDAFAVVMNAAGNPTGLALLKSGINGGKVRYVHTGCNFDDAAGIEGLRVRVLGPPRDKEFLARTDPPSGDRLSKLDAGGRLIAPDTILPFVDKWTAKSQPLGALGDDDKEALNSLSENSSALGFALDQALNSTSLITLLSFRGKNLLFCGDAQHGSWESRMNSSQAASILEHLDFFKVPHHGSCNGTPRNVLERMCDGFVAMISTQNRPWPSIPHDKLLKQLEEKARAVVRSDSIEIANATEAVPKGPDLELEPGSGLSVGPFWCDYTISL